MKTSPPIVLAFITRNRPHMLISSLDLVYRSAQNPDNFEVHIIIDRGQEELYAPVSMLYPKIKLVAVEHEDNNMNNCFRGTLRAFLETTASYFITACDDLTHVINHWDRRILESGNYFADGLWALYGTSSDASRVPAVMEACYCVEPADPVLVRVQDIARYYPALDPNDRSDLDFFVIYGFADPFPVITRTFARFVEKVYARVTRPTNSDFVMAALVQQLYRISGEKRNMPGLPGHFRTLDHGTTFGLMHGKPLDMQIVCEVAREMAEYITNFATKHHEAHV